MEKFPRRRLGRTPKAVSSRRGSRKRRSRKPRARKSIQVEEARRKSRHCSGLGGWALSDESIWPPLNAGRKKRLQKALKQLKGAYRELIELAKPAPRRGRPPRRARHECPAGRRARICRQAVAGLSVRPKWKVAGDRARLSCRDDQPRNDPPLLARGRSQHRHPDRIGLRLLGARHRRRRRRGEPARPRSQARPAAANARGHHRRRRSAPLVPLHRADSVERPAASRPASIPRRRRLCGRAAVSSSSGRAYAWSVDSARASWPTRRIGWCSWRARSRHRRFRSGRSRASGRDRMASPMPTAAPRSIARSQHSPPRCPARAITRSIAPRSRLFQLVAGGELDRRSGRSIG